MITGRILSAASLVLASLASGTAAEAEPTPTAADLYIAEYAVDGNTVLDQSSIERAVYPFLGPGRSAADIEHARDALEKAFQANGYQTVEVAVTDATPVDGVVHLQVTELKVGRLRVVGARYYLPSEVKAEAPSVQEGNVPNFNALRDDVVTLNELPGREVTPALKAGKDPGTVDVDLLVKDEFPIHAELEVNNQQSVDTTALRLAGSISYDNLWQLGHKLSLAFQAAPENIKDAEVFSASYLARFAGSPYSILLNAIVSNSNVSTVGSTNVIGKGDIIGIRGLVDLPGDADFNQSVQAGLDYKDFRNDTRFFGTSTGSSENIVPVTYFPFVASYSAALQEATASDSVNASLNVALPGAGSSRARFDADRYDARGQELYFRGELERSQKLPYGFSLYARVEGQLTDQPLISNDQFSLGGVRSIRGYFESERLVDTGFSGTLQLNTPSIAGFLDDAVDRSDAVNSLVLFAFIDGGQGHILQPLPQQESNFSLASLGFGADARLFNHLNGSVDLAFPRITTDNTRSGSEEILFRVATEY